MSELRLQPRKESDDQIVALEDELVYDADDFARSDEELKQAHQKMLLKRMIAKEFSSTRASKDISRNQSTKISKTDLEFLLVKEKDFIFLNGLLILRQTKWAQVLRLLLVVFLFLERFSFIVIVYKTKCSNYVLLLTVVVLNLVVLFIMQLKNKQKVKDKMSHLFKIHST